MAYNEFTFNQLRKDYGLEIVNEPALFADAPPKSPFPIFPEKAIPRVRIKFRAFCVLCRNKEASCFTEVCHVHQTHS